MGEDVRQHGHLAADVLRPLRVDVRHAGVLVLGRLVALLRLVSGVVGVDVFYVDDGYGRPLVNDRRPDSGCEVLELFRSGRQRDREAPGKPVRQTHVVHDRGVVGRVHETAVRRDRTDR